MKTPQKGTPEPAQQIGPLVATSSARILLDVDPADELQGIWITGDPATGRRVVGYGVLGQHGGVIRGQHKWKEVNPDGTPTGRQGVLDLVPNTYGVSGAGTRLADALITASTEHDSHSGQRNSYANMQDFAGLFAPDSGGGGSARQVPDPSGQAFTNCRPGDTWYPWLQVAHQIGLISGQADGSVNLALGPQCKIVVNALRWAAGQAPL